VSTELIMSAWAPADMAGGGTCLSCLLLKHKVVDYSTNEQRLCDFLLVRRSNLGHILHRFRDIAGFLLMTPPLFHSNFGVFPLDQIAAVGISPSQNLNLISREIILEVFQSMWKTYLNVTDRRTDGQTDGQHTVRSA